MDKREGRQAARPALPGFAGRGQRAVGLLVALAMGISGFLALETGLVMHPEPLYHPAVAAERATLIQRLRSNDAELAQGHYFAIGLEGGLIALATSKAHLYESRLPELTLYYASMPTLNIVMLAAHTALAAFCMLVGAFQFWPAFRRRYPKMHRRFGVIYIATVVPSTVFAMVYLALTPPYQLYTGLTGYVALWLVSLLVLAALGLAMYHLRRREIGQHQAYMSLSFGLLMVAPLLRWNWVLLAQFLPGIEQETISLSTLIFLVPEALLLSHVLLVLNREQQRPRPVPVTLAVGEFVRARLHLLVGALGLLAVACLMTVVWHFLVLPGLEQSGPARLVVPAAVLQQQATVLNADASGRALYILGTGMALLLMPWFVRAAFRQPHGVLPPRLRGLAIQLALAAGLAGLVEIRWGWQLGLPTGLAQQSGGTFYTAAGLLSVAFSAMLLRAALTSRLAAIKEWGLFTLLSAMFSSLFYWSLSLLSWLPWPSVYVQDGQLYELAAGAAPVILLIGFFYTIYGQATRERFAV